VTGTPALARKLDAERARADAAIRRALESRGMQGAGAVSEAVRYAMVGGGKRLRPVLCAGGYRAVARAEPPAAVYDAAVAIELVHTYSLVHDDLPIMDDDDLRRGRPTVHRMFGERVATVAGTALIPLAAAQLAAAARTLCLSDERTAAVSAELTRAAGAGGMVGGQLMDLEAEGGAPTVAALDAIHARKTGALFAASLRIGGLLGAATEAQVGALGAFGAALGLAFQIADDVLDETGDAERLGKTAGKDRVSDKATFPALLGIDGARQRAEAAVTSGLAALDGEDLHDDALRALIRFAADRDR
jgi:geranylgeranyl pyrophosphate synthase